MATNEELIKTMCSEDFNKFLFQFMRDEEDEDDEQV